MTVGLPVGILLIVLLFISPAVVLWVMIKLLSFFDKPSSKNSSKKKSGGMT